MLCLDRRVARRCGELESPRMVRRARGAPERAGAGVHSKLGGGGGILQRAATQTCMHVAAEKGVAAARASCLGA